jgi:hypothetical protein
VSAHNVKAQLVNGIRKSGLSCLLRRPAHLICRQAKIATGDHEYGRRHSTYLSPKRSQCTASHWLAQWERYDFKFALNSGSILTFVGTMLSPPGEGFNWAIPLIFKGWLLNS